MKLQQGQVWKRAGDYLRIVKWGRLSIDYKRMKGPDSKEGDLHTATKKEFCRLIKGAALYQEDSS